MFDKLYEDVIVLGHDNPDTDSVISGILMAKLLVKQGVKARFIIPDKAIDEVTRNICFKYGIDVTKYQGEIPENANLVLVDHYKTDINNKIVGVVDHHPTLEKTNCDFYLNVPSSSTAMLVYKLDENAFDANDIKLVVVSNLVDTINFTSAKTVMEDKYWTIDVCNKYNYNYEEIAKDGLCLTSLDDLDEAAIHGEKSYEYASFSLKSSYIQVDSIDDNKIIDLLNILKQKLILDKLYMWVFLIQNVKELKSKAYLLQEDKIDVINYNYLASRGNSVMPDIERRLLLKISH